MIQVISSTHQEEWNRIVDSFSNADVYYLNGYVRAFEIHGDGVAHLLYYSEDDIRAIYVFMLRPTAIDGVFDTITPYGYGGVLFDHIPTVEQVQTFWQEYSRKMRELSVVDNFVRYHPILQNAEPMKAVTNVIDLGHTIAIHLNSEEEIWNNFSPKNKNKIRKAEKNGVVIRHGHDISLIDPFINIYNATMQKDDADDYYYFSREFYESIFHDLEGHFEMFYALIGEQIVAMSIMLFSGTQMHYHLSGSLTEFRNVAPTNLLLYKASMWGLEQGFHTLHLGGGLGSAEDSLYEFKKGFNRQSDYTFAIGKDIFDQKLYNDLIKERQSRDEGFDGNSSFFPAYRA